jgi:hypothetical protein
MARIYGDSEYRWRQRKLTSIQLVFVFWMQAQPEESVQQAFSSSSWCGKVAALT